MIIVITPPSFIDNEAQRIVRLFEERGIDYLHLRKPDASEEAVEKLLNQIPAEYYPRIAMHDFHNLAMKYQLGGIHLTSRNPQAPAGWERRISTSCHSIEELLQRKGEGVSVNGVRRAFAYLSLSPIFDSVSKQGYHAAFSGEALSEAKDRGIIDQGVMALGGVTFDRLALVERMGFGGGMILGDAWKN